MLRKHLELKAARSDRSRIGRLSQHQIDRYCSHYYEACQDYCLDAEARKDDPKAFSSWLSARRGISRYRKDRLLQAV